MENSMESSPARASVIQWVAMAEAEGQGGGGIAGGGGVEARHRREEEEAAK